MAYFRTSRVFKLLRTPFYLISTVTISSNENSNKKTQTDWKNRIKSNYLNRIRDLSSPEKVFNTFASVNKPGEPLNVMYMTIDDFISSLIPFSFSAEEKGRLMKAHNKHFFDIVDADSDGLISLSEYLLFSTLLSIPENHIATAFKMFDLDGNGRVDIEEFFNLIDVMKNKNSSYVSLKNFAKDINLLRSFFGENLKDTLTYEDFNSFIRRLRTSVNSLEFDLYDAGQKNVISTGQFALSIIAYCSKYKAEAYMQRLDNIPAELQNETVSREDFINFNRVLGSLDEISYALRVFSRSSKILDKADFLRAVKTVTGVTLSKPQVDVIFCIFDESGTGNLKHEDLLTALSFRYYNRKDIWVESGARKTLECLVNCVRR